ncbi:carotenoid-cleaving dioxygenase, mitochondrial-like isoform X1 [Hyla sarda]|uniref:carotenoid-cleaving dioxygenase, mitochondrial-like isoform X1 n=2 Tax=Hyla sarda TaxID=327740 RepID=UPI0024C3677A|nr:carotenoid-cleaving dioxygenase, mitochondrial-like isoform X1 [Hyla sarda]
MDFIFSFLHNIPVLRNVFHEDKYQLCSSTEEEKECIAALFQTVEETPQPISTRITGSIPEWITGSLFRNGPGRFEFGNDKFNHWFDGMSLMHKFTIENGNVTYMSKFLRSDSYKSNESENRIVVSEFGTVAMPDPCKSMFQRFVSMFEMPKATDNGNVNFVKYKKDYFVSTESALIRKVDLATLETAEKVDWSKYIAVNGATAHPHYDPDGTVYNMGNSYGKQGTLYNIIRVPAQELEDEDTLHGAEVICSIPASDKWNPSYYHSFGMTQNYIVFIEQPIKINVLKIITGNITGSPISGSLGWDAKCDTVFHVANKHTGELHSVTFHAQGVAMFHQINAYEDQDCIVLDLCCQDDGDAVQLFNLQNLRKSGEALNKIYHSVKKSFPRRFVFPLTINSETPYDVNINPLSYTTATVEKRADGKVWCTPENLYDHTIENVGGLEFPAINYTQYNTKKYRYFYGCGLQHLVGSCLVKMDVDTKQLKVWQEDGFYPSEPVFVASPHSCDEDDGVLLSAVVSPRQDKTAFLLILDAKNFKEIGRAEVPVQMPYGFHGIFLPQNK